MLSMLIGVISDTHGLLRPETLEALTGVEHIIHAGDIGSPDIVPPPGKDRAGHRHPRQRRYPGMGTGSCQGGR